MQITITNSSGSFDVTNLTASAVWSGGRGQCARMLSFGLLSSAETGVIDCSLGSAVTLSENGALLFSGFIFERTKTTADSVIDITCFDRGYYLKKNKMSRSIIGQTAESVTAAIAGEFGIACGDISATGITLSRNFLGGYSIYDLLSTLFTMASEQNGKKYIIVFEGEKLCVKEIGAGTMVFIKGKSNLVDATVTESNKNLINSVLVLDKNGNTLFSQADSGSVSLYGTMQQTIKQSDSIDTGSVIEKLLKSAVPEQKITVTCLGNTSCVTGGAVMLSEAVTGLCGKFFIDSDTHTWKNGIYTNKLVLTFEAMADEKSVGSSAVSIAGNGGYAEKLEKLHNSATEVK